MRHRGLVWLFSVLGVLFFLAGAAFGAFWTLDNYILVHWHLYPKNAQMLDLRGEKVSASTYDVLTRAFPGRVIRWDVPYKDITFPDDSTEITVIDLTDKDVQALRYLTRLETVHAEHCNDYAQLMELQRLMPNCKVEYMVPVGSRSYSQDTVSIQAPGLNAEQAAMLQYLPALSHVDATGCTDYDLLQSLANQHPEWGVTFSIPIAGEYFSSDETEVTVDGASYKEVVRGIAGMPHLQSITLRNPAMELEELLQLRQDNPGIGIHWELDFYDYVITDDATELDISCFPLDSIAHAKKLAGYCPQLEKLIVDSGSIPNDDMAAFREEMRSQYKVVWTVYFTDKCKARTDETSFIPIKQGEYYFQEQHVYNLRYCEDMIAIDVGHSVIKTIDFCRFMPHLKYLILAHTQVKDITPISDCKELIFLELDWSLVTDYTPLLGCTALEDLNLGKTYGSEEPICQMTWLKHLWWLEKNTRGQIALREALTETQLNFGGNATVANGWRNLPNYYAMRDALGMYYMEW